MAERDAALDGGAGVQPSASRSRDVIMVYRRKMVSNAISLMLHNVVVSVLNAITELRGHLGLK